MNGTSLPAGTIQTSGRRAARRRTGKRGMRSGTEIQSPYVPTVSLGASASCSSRDRSAPGSKKSSPSTKVTQGAVAAAKPALRAAASPLGDS